MPALPMAADISRVQSIQSHSLISSTRLQIPIHRPLLKKMRLYVCSHVLCNLMNIQIENLQRSLKPAVSNCDPVTQTVRFRMKSIPCVWLTPQKKNCAQNVSKKCIFIPFAKAFFAFQESGEEYCLFLFAFGLFFPKRCFQLSV